MPRLAYGVAERMQVVRLCLAVACLLVWDRPAIAANPQPVGQVKHVRAVDEQMSDPNGYVRYSEVTSSCMVQLVRRRSEVHRVKAAVAASTPASTVLKPVNT